MVDELKDEIKKKKSEQQNKKFQHALLAFVFGFLGAMIILSVLRGVQFLDVLPESFGLGIALAIAGYSNYSPKQDEYLQNIRFRVGGVSLLITLLLLYVIGSFTNIELPLQGSVALFMLLFGVVFWIIYFIMKRS